MLEFLYNKLQELTSLSDVLLKIIVILCALVLVLTLARIMFVIANRYLHNLFIITKKNYAHQWLIFLNPKFINKLAHLAPIIVLYVFSLLFRRDLDSAGENLSLVYHNIAMLYLNLVTVLLIDDLLDLGRDVYETFAIAKRNPIRSYIQVAKIIIVIAAGIIALATILDKSPLSFLTGIGAMMTLILLIFKDSILGFNTAIQLAAYDIIRIGDYVTIPAFNADGHVEEIALTTIKIRNFDKTLSTIPTANLLNQGITNWRGMTEAGGRRIKRHILIDETTIKFCTLAMLEELQRLTFIKDIVVKNIQNRNYYQPNQADTSQCPTNIGLYREYALAYLRQHPQIHQQDFTFLVRELTPHEHGISLEIYVFTTTTDLAEYETIQAGIIDHLFAMLPLFGLNRESPKRK